MVKDNENGVSAGFHFRPQNTDTKWQTFQKAIYNGETGEVFGRTAKNWGQLLIFYAIFYIILAALFAICMQSLLATLDDKEPKWQLESSLIGTNPGLGFRPISKRTEEGSLIWYQIKNKTTTDKWSGLLDEFLKQYKVNQTGDNFVTCNFNEEAPEGKVCKVELDQFKNCGPSNNYGYGNGSTSPCVFLKLNKIFGWRPNCITEPSDDMPADLHEHIAQLRAENRSQIWISCRGEAEADRENVAKFNYYPGRGIPAYYFPYKNVENYLSPLIAVEIINPKPNVIITIECRAWAKNINYHGGNLQREGSITFELLLD